MGSPGRPELALHAQAIFLPPVPGWLGWGTAGSHRICPHPPQVVSSILRNLSWRADINSKKVLREVGSMTALTQCVLRASKVGMGTLATGSEPGPAGGGSSQACSADGPAAAGPGVASL